MCNQQPPVVAAEPADVRQVIRRDLWCDLCHRGARFELDVINRGEVVVTLQGCFACRTGLCRELAA